jgi:hypothetical protein
MIPPQTYEVQVGYALNLIDSEAVVAWAIDAIISGSDSESLRILAGLEQPFDQEEVKRLHRKSLRELGIIERPPESHVLFYIHSILQKMLAEKLTRKAALKSLADLCTNRNYDPKLWDFYLLYNAKWDLELQAVQWYWKNADRSNIDIVIDHYATNWLKEHTVDTKEIS